MNSNQLERAMSLIGIPDPVTEYRFDIHRRWRFDYAWPERKLALEVDGGIWTRGRHVRPQGFEKDIEKRNAAVLQGWRVLHATTDMVRDGRVLRLLEEAFRVLEPVK